MPKMCNVVKEEKSQSKCRSKMELIMVSFHGHVIKFYDLRGIVDYNRNPRRYKGLITNGHIKENSAWAVCVSAYTQYMYRRKYQLRLLVPKLEKIVHTTLAQYGVKRKNTRQNIGLVKPMNKCEPVASNSWRVKMHGEHSLEEQGLHLWDLKSRR